MANEIQFRNPELNKKYQILSEKDRKIHTPEGYSGMLSQVTDAKIIEGLIGRGNNIVAAKTAIASTGSKN